MGQTPFSELRGPKSGPISRQRDRCYDCGAEPGTRHAAKCDLSPTASWVQEWWLDGRLSGNSVWGPETHEVAVAELEAWAEGS